MSDHTLSPVHTSTYSITDFIIPLPTRYNQIYAGTHNQSDLQPVCSEYALSFSCQIAIVSNPQHFNDFCALFEGYESTGQLSDELQVDEDNYTNKVLQSSARNVFTADPIIPFAHYTTGVNASHHANRSPLQPSSVLNQFSQSQYPNTIYPSDCSIIHLNQLPSPSTASNPAPQRTQSPSLFTKLPIPPLSQQIKSHSFDFVSILETCTTSLNYVNFDPTPSNPDQQPNQPATSLSIQHVYENCTYSNHSAGQRNGEENQQCVQCHLQRILRYLRTSISSFCINIPLLYHYDEITELLHGEIEKGNEVARFPSVRVEITKISGSIIPLSAPTSAIHTTSIPNSQFSYPFVRHPAPITTPSQSHPYEHLCMQVERNHWGMVIVVYENHLVELPNNPMRDLQPEDYFTGSYCTNSTVHRYPQFSQSTGVYSLCIKPYKQIPPHYHNILDEAELNLATSVARRTHNVSNPSYPSLRSSWGLTNHWNAPHQDSPTDTAPFVHTYNNFSPFFARVMCISFPTFIPDDELILGTIVHHNDLAGKKKTRPVCGNDCVKNRPTALPPDQLLTFHPRDPQYPWLSDRTWRLQQNATFHFPGCFSELNQSIDFKLLSQDSTLTELADAVLAIIVIVGENRQSSEFKTAFDLFTSSSTTTLVSRQPTHQHTPSHPLLQIPQLLFTVHSQRGVELPGGKIDPSDISPVSIMKSEQVALFREIEEETGVVLDPEANTANCFPFARYIIAERNPDDHSIVRHIKDTFVVLLSYEDAKLSIHSNRPDASQNTAQYFCSQPSFETSECGNCFLRPLYDIIPSHSFIQSRVGINSGRGEKISPLLREQVFPLALRRLQAILHPISQPISQ